MMIDAGGDVQSAASVIEKHMKRAGELKDRVEAEARARAPERKEEKTYQKKVREKDDILGKTQDMLDGKDPGVDLDDPREHCLNQERVDHVRAQVTMRTLIQQYRRGRDIEELPLQYLWFPYDDFRKPTLREGNPPADIDRPVRMRRLNLVLDYHNVPFELREICKHAAAAINRRHKKLNGPDPIKRAFQDDQALAVALKGKLGLTRR